MLKYILFIIAVGTLCCCKEPFITITRSKATPKKVIIYPPEKSEIAAMEIGDTINIFYKKTGWFNSAASVYVTENVTYYSMETIWRVDSSKYLYVSRYAYPEKWFGKPLDFNSLKSDPKTLFQTIGKLDYWCGFDTIINWDGNFEICKQSFSYSPADSTMFSILSDRELTSKRFQNWRFSPPTNEQLNSLRENIGFNSGFYFHEMLLVSKDTIKLSYSEDCTASLALFYPY